MRTRRQVISVVCLVAMAVPVPAWAAAGDVDAIVRTLIGRRTAVTTVLLQPDGKIVVAGGADTEGNEEDFVLVRYNADLSVDRTFGVGGLTTTFLSVQDDYATGLVRQTNGKLVLAGTAGGYPFGFALTRYDQDGHLDPTFGSNGVVRTSPDEFSQARALALQADDKLVVVGCSAPDNSCNIGVVVRYNPDGSLDTTFAENGVMKLTPKDSSDIDFDFEAVLVQPDHKIVAAGRHDFRSARDLVVVRLNEDGSLDDTFGKNGVANGGTGVDLVNGIARQPDGKLLVSGWTFNITFLLARFDANGSLDRTFADDGTVEAAIDIDNTGARVVVQPDGRLVLAGTAAGEDSPNFGSSFALVRYNADGSLDSTFGIGGKVRTPIGDMFVTLGDITLLPNGKLLAVGVDVNRLVLVRYQGDTLPVPTPTATPTPGPGSGESSSCAIRPASQSGLLPILLLPLLVLLRRFFTRTDNLRGLMACGDLAAPPQRVKGTGTTTGTALSRTSGPDQPRPTRAATGAGGIRYEAPLTCIRSLPRAPRHTSSRRRRGWGHNNHVSLGTAVTKPRRKLHGQR
jgi:uncharacterized delta-60 repeat protein